MSPCGIVSILILYAGLTGGAVYGAMNITIDYKTIYFIGPNAYLRDYFEKSDKYFTAGNTVTFYTDGENDYFSKKS